MSTEEIVRGYDFQAMLVSIGGLAARKDGPKAKSANGLITRLFAPSRSCGSFLLENELQA
jgi:hypothetical protein